MKKLILFQFIFLCSFQIIYSQSGWFPLSSGTQKNLFELSFLNTNTGYVCGDSGTILKTTNGGNNWNSNIINLKHFYQSIYFTDINTGYVCGSDSGYISGVLFKTSNGGTNWFALNPGPSLPFNSVYFYNSNSGYLTGYQGAILKTTNGGINWNLCQTGSILPFYGIYFPSIDTGYSVGGIIDYQGIIYKTTNGGINWLNIFNNTGEPIYSVYFVNNNTGYAVGGDYEYSGTIYKTLNGGVNWTNQNFQTFGPLTKIAFVDLNTGYCVGFSGIFKTINGGVNWSNQLIGYNYYPRSILMLNSNTGFVVGINGIILKTTDGGEGDYYSVSGTIMYKDNNQPVTHGYVKALKFNTNINQIIMVDSTRIQSNGTYTLSHVPQDSLDIMAYGDDEYDFVPTYHDSTIYWRDAHIIYPTTNLTNINVKVFRLNKTASQTHISGGVYKYTMSSVGLKNAIVYAKIGDQFKGYAISGNTGLYRIDTLPMGDYQIICDRLGFDGGTKNISLSNISQDTVNFYINQIISVKKESITIPKSFILYQNYPNPFNPSTTIRFALPKSTHVQLVIYDVLGKEVIQLVNEQLNAGTYSILWNAYYFASGLYFYKLMSADFVETKKLVLIK